MKNRLFRNVCLFDGANLPSGNGDLLLSFDTSLSEVNGGHALLDVRECINGGGSLATTWKVYCGVSDDQLKILFEKDDKKILFIKLIPTLGWLQAVRGGEDRLISSEGNQSLDALFEEFIAHNIVLALPLR